MHIAKSDFPHFPDGVSRIIQDDFEVPTKVPETQYALLTRLKCYKAPKVNAVKRVSFDEEGSWRAGVSFELYSCICFVTNNRLSVRLKV